ncbi:MAG: glutamate--tRNA ligase [Acidobacteriota bacterium]
MEKVIVRFAPSPTGYLHIGSARTALFNWLFARHTGGTFLLRIEDTDIDRSQQHFLDEILTDLRWLGIDWDGEPIFQSKRFSFYREQAEKLLHAGKAYHEGDAIIFKVEKGHRIEVQDLIHGSVTFNTDMIKDQVLIKSDGSPAYNFSCVVDDADLEITHILRGDDHLSNTPKQILFYEAFNLPLPKFAHMPLIMGMDGTKLSKRHGGISVNEYKKEGFLPGALVNYLILLGWSPREGEEVMSMNEAVRRFDISEMNDVQAKFDIHRLRWMNAEHIVRKKAEELLPLIKEQLVAAGADFSRFSDEYLVKLVELHKIRIKTLQEFVPLTEYFFKDDFALEEKGRGYLRKEENRRNLELFARRLEALDDFSKENIEKICRDFAGEKCLKAADIIHPARVAISGQTKGAGLFEIMELMGKEKVLKRLRSVGEWKN